MLQMWKQNIQQQNWTASQYIHSPPNCSLLGTLTVQLVVAFTVVTQISLVSGEIIQCTDEPQRVWISASRGNKLSQSQCVFPLFSTGTYVTQVTATDADDPTYGNSARVVYSILHGQPYFSVDPKTGIYTSFW